MKYLLNVEYSVTAVNYSEWKMLESQLLQNWKKYRSESHVNVNLKSQSRPVFTQLLTHAFPSPIAHTQKHHINIAGVPLMLLSGATILNSFLYTLQHCQNIWINIIKMIYSRMLPQLLTDKPKIWGTTLWPFSHRTAVANISYPAPPEISKFQHLSSLGAFSKRIRQKSSAVRFASNNLLANYAVLN